MDEEGEIIKKIANVGEKERLGDKREDADIFIILFLGSILLHFVIKSVCRSACVYIVDAANCVLG